MTTPRHGNTDPKSASTEAPDLPRRMAALELEQLSMLEEIRRLQDRSTHAEADLVELDRLLGTLGIAVLQAAEWLLWAAERLGAHSVLRPATDSTPDLSGTPPTASDSPDTTSSPRPTDHTAEVPDTTASPEPPAGSRP